MDVRASVHPVFYLGANCEKSQVEGDEIQVHSGQDQTEQKGEEAVKKAKSKKWGRSIQRKGESGLMFAHYGKGKPSKRKR